LLLPRGLKVKRQLSSLRLSAIVHERDGLSKSLLWILLPSAISLSVFVGPSLQIEQSPVKAFPTLFELEGLVFSSCWISCTPTVSLLSFNQISPLLFICVPLGKTLSPPPETHFNRVARFCLRSHNHPPPSLSQFALNSSTSFLCSSEFDSKPPLPPRDCDRPRPLFPSYFHPLDHLGTLLPPQTHAMRLIQAEAAHAAPGPK